MECTIYTNTQSLLAHTEEIQHLIMIKMNYAIMALTESRLTGEIDDNEVSMPGYSMVRGDSDSRNAGCVTV